jgi:hypothetical protein
MRSKAPFTYSILPSRSFTMTDSGQSAASQTKRGSMRYLHAARRRAVLISVKSSCASADQNRLMRWPPSSRCSPPLAVPRAGAGFHAPRARARGRRGEHQRRLFDAAVLPDIPLDDALSDLPARVARGFAPDFDAPALGSASSSPPTATSSPRTISSRMPSTTR